MPDGAAAVRAVRSGRFALATMDLRMPGMTGRQTLALLRQLAPEIAVVVVSGYVTPAESNACLALGAVAIVHKPFEVESLLRVLRRAREEPHPSDAHAPVSPSDPPAGTERPG